MEIGIVGAGVGGLVSALLLSKQGHQVTIYEKEGYLGGRLTFQGNGRYQIDQGPTIVLLPELLLSILEEAGISKEDIPLIPCEPLYDLHFHDGSTYTKYRDLPTQLKELEQKFPGESKNLLKYLSDMSNVFELGMEAFLSKTFKRKQDFLTIENIKLLAQSKAYKTLKNFNASYFSHPNLQEAYSLQSLYIGGSPYEVPALYGLVSYSEHAHGIWYLKGGYGSLIPILEKACIEQGVKINLHSKVDRLLIEAGVCKGLSVNNETTFYDAVIFNGDFPNLYSMVGKKKKEKKFQPSSGCVLIYLGVSKRFPKAKAHQFFLPKDFEKNMAQVFKTKQIPEDPSYYVFNPVALEDEAAPPGESVLYFLIPVPSGDQIDWETSGPMLAEQVLMKAEKHFIGLHEAVEWMEIRTPADSIRDGLYQGGSFGIAPNLFQSGGFRPQLSPFKIDRLYSVGASIHPGGGIPIVLQGARLLSELIKKELRT
ncbi:phytoene desaturase family protein [Neobacillus sp. PS2-9]|uniref:phytoene desaturase family protein n=1 Tax=Neobacillus sp. PS2-9 TaxID=3070676 RepID=UPI0027E12E1C|nr:phytoene desaturase family protein [Neobacillus sp. PS2-9]WML56726.1 phytoene desaturase family protein [Neobacillus sp. PS2-9]